MIDTVLNLHFIFASIFLLYIFIDRSYIRVFIEEKNREKFYKRVKLPMLFLCLVLLFTGTFLVIKFFSIIVVLKAIIAVILIISFFYCPFYMKKEESVFKRFMYRYWVVFLTVLTFFLGLYI